MARRTAAVLAAVCLSLLGLIATLSGASRPAWADSSSVAAMANAGFWLAAPSGQVVPFGEAARLGSTPPLGTPVVAAAGTKDAQGYWLASSGGGVFTFGDAGFFGSAGALRLSRPVTAMAPTPDGLGYWLVGSDGGIFTFGDAGFFGSTGALRLSQPIVAMAPTPDGLGYWLVGSDGGVFTFGDAGFFGSAGSLHLAGPVVGMAPTPDGGGYWLVGRDGGVFSFGDAGWYGSVQAREPVERIVSAPDGQGYWIVTQTGDAFAYGSASSTDLPVQALVYRSVTTGDRAVDFAVAQLGKPYVWGAAGPGSFDCSGLTLRAWQYAAGVTIPRVAADQYGFGAKVPLGALSAGDLVYWSDSGTDPAAIGHVALYVGGGWMINAPHTGTVVRADAIGGSGFVSFGTRP